MLKVHTDDLEDIAVLYVQGRIVRGEELAMLRSAVFSQADARVVILDLALVKVIDAGGLGTLLELREWALSNGIEFKLENPNELVASLFKITRLDSVLEVLSEPRAILCGAIAA